MRRSVAGRLATSMTGVVVGALLAAGCGSSPSGASGSGSKTHVHAPSRDPHTGAALLRIARQFNNDYATNHDAAVYARWDPASRKVISRQAYLQRHTECPNPPEGHVNTWGVAPGPDGAWLVHYSIGGQEFTDYWYYIKGRWEFDLPRSNPTAVPLYRMSPSKYAKAIGCGK